VDGWIQDIRHAARSVAGAKGFAAIVVATLALGIGANTAVFGVLHAVVLSPLPYSEPERLVRLYQTRGTEDNYLPGPAVVELRDRTRTLDLAAVYTYQDEGADLTDRAQPERVRTLRVSADYFRVMRVNPIAGRVFERADEREDARVAVISERIWREYLGGAPGAAGRTLSLNGIPYQVAGVLPGTFDDPLEPGVEVWTPLNLQPGDSNSWDNNYLSVMGRLRPGVTLAEAQAEISTLAPAMAWNTPETPVRKSARVTPLQADTVGSAGPMLWILLGAVGLLLVIACVNVASLFLARGAAREPELAVRAALGCSRWRLVRQLLTESLLLSIAGGIAGLLLAQVITRALLAAAPGAVARSGGGTLESAVFAFSFGVALLAGLGFGMAPAVQATRPNLERVLRQSGRSGGGSRHQTRTRNALVVCQLALALILLVGAGLLLRSFANLRSVNLGVQPADVMTFQVHLPSGRYEDSERRAQFHREFQRRVAALPGVRAVGSISRLPVTGSFHSWGTRRPDRPELRGISGQQRVIEGAYFEAVGIPLLRGRTFGPEDRADAPTRVVVSQELARQLFAGEDPLGKSVRAGGREGEIIGVVGDVALTPRGTPQPYVYHSHSQFASNRNWTLIQLMALDRPVAGLLGQVRRELAAIDPALVLHDPTRLEDVIGGGIAHERFALLLIGAFAALAILLAAVGIYGVLSYAVSRRSREMGIRMALGAPVGAVRSLVVRDGGRLAAAGVAIGLAGAYAATRALESLLFGVSSTEPGIFLAAAAVLAAVALAASWIPARTATKVNPLESLRADA
jgi:putative ABC transport system permease protein